MATTYSDTNISNLIINKMSKSEYDGLTSTQKQANELFLVEEAMDYLPMYNSTNVVSSGGIYNALTTKEDIVPISTTLPSGPLTLNTYYKVTTPLTGAVTLTLPEVTDSSHIYSIILYFSTAAEFTSLTIIPSSGTTISYYENYIILPLKNYEINLMFNGGQWVVSYAVVN